MEISFLCKVKYSKFDSNSEYAQTSVLIHQSISSGFIPNNALWSELQHEIFI
jgi:hypothetical protein